MVGEKLGRIRSIGFGVVIMIAGAIMQATAYSRGHMIAARIVTGIGMGIINSTTPVLQVSSDECFKGELAADIVFTQAEYSPQASRGVCE
jgi:MFS family permease